MKIDPRMIIQFSVVAEEGSFTKAAERLRVAQPWLSARIRQLEAQIGFSLLTRSTRKVALTERGAEFLPVARAVAAAVDASEALAQQLQRTGARRLRIGAPPYSARIAVRRDLIDRFAAAYRDVSIELDISWSPGLPARVLSGDLDLAFVMGALDDPAIDTIVLRRMGVGLMMSRTHPLAALSIIPPAKLLGYPVTVFTRSLNPGLFDMMYAPLMEAGVKLMQTPEMADTPPYHMDDDEMIAAFFAFNTEPVDHADVAQRPLDAEMLTPFSLIRRHGAASPLSCAFWRMVASESR